MNIHVLTIPNDEIRKRAGFTGADWWFDENDDIQIRVAQMSCREREMALAIHEAVEAVICHFHHVDVANVDAFDAHFEKMHPENHGLDAGDAPHCPYGREHMAATACERVVAMEIGVGSWKEYDDEVGKL